MFRFRWLLILGIVLTALAYWQWYIKPVTQENQAASLLPLLQPAEPQPIRLLFGGDLMFDRHIRQFMAAAGVEFILEPMTETFQAYDAVVANLEGPITDFPSRSVNSVVGSTNNFIFTFDPNVVPMLKQHDFIVNLGNNHILNFGAEGVRQTKQYLANNKLEFFGNTSWETSSAERILIKDFGELTLAFVNYNQFVDQGFPTALADVAAAKPLSDLVIVMPHWGNEYETTANQVVQNWAHQLLDAGADLIIGGHPHVIQQTEVYQGKTIYYSLGNFVFDQYFEPAVGHGLLVGVEIFSDHTMTFTELPIQLTPNGQTQLIQP